MKCIVCDRCGGIIKNPKTVRVITCARPLKPPVIGEGANHYRGSDRQMNDILWEKDICPTCLDELETFIEQSSNDANQPEAPKDDDDTVAGGDISE